MKFLLICDPWRLDCRCVGVDEGSVVVVRMIMNKLRMKLNKLKKINRAMNAATTTKAL